MTAQNINVEEQLKELGPETLHHAVQKIAKLKEVHNELLKQPFCHKRQQLVRIIMCLDYDYYCRWEGLCYRCFEQGIKHKLLYTPPIENLSLVKICSDTYDWHSAYNDFKELVDLGVLCL